MTTTLTITEALAEIKMVKAKVEKKETFIYDHLARQGIMRDPLESDGGSTAKIGAERQAIRDLLERLRQLRLAIQGANMENDLKIGAREMSVAGWLTWRRDAAPLEARIVRTIQKKCADFRRGLQQYATKEQMEDGNPAGEPVIHVDESQIQTEVEAIQEQLDTLDGRLSLFNATCNIEV